MKPEVVVAKKRGTPYRSITTLYYILVASGVFLVGVYCLYLGGEQTQFWNAHTGWRTLLEQLGGLLIVTSGLSILWELIGKRAFAKEVLESTRMVTEIDSAGIKRITNQFYDESMWKDCFRGTEKLDIFAAYANTWRNTYMPLLQEIARKPKGRIRIYLTDPEDPTTLATLAHRFGTTPEKLKERIWDTRDAFEALRVEGGASVEVFYWRGDRVFTFYRFDNRVVLALYQHSGQRSPSLPTMVCENGGSLFQFVYDELVSIRNSSRSALPAAASPGEASTATVTQLRDPDSKRTG
ncbi:hypothetical protein [Paractinoplanes toevensis]|uniref:Uncharacterized protein n=1 Tax=Paractinoplanes toevensis TaxID=571911 RepID=A0A919W8U1_9ACTN|nr:hypothetical protein [Actinoplanes toevensis]GIM95631.1 hypothetical protein Ato02nite_074240 [Actinoplanes toevensis]